MFLGDEGSYLLGGFFGIAFIKAFNSGFGLTAFGILWLPLLDLTLGFLRRALNGKSKTLHKKHQNHNGHLYGSGFYICLSFTFNA